MAILLMLVIQMIIQLVNISGMDGDALLSTYCSTSDQIGVGRKIIIISNFIYLFSFSFSHFIFHFSLL